MGRKRGKRLTASAPPTLSMTMSTPRFPVMRATPSARLSAERSMTSLKPRARACLALAGLVVVEIALPAPCARAKCVTAFPVGVHRCSSSCFAEVFARKHGHHWTTIGVSGYGPWLISNTV